jgi:hypothetical protein
MAGALALTLSWGRCQSPLVGMGRMQPEQSTAIPSRHDQRPQDESTNYSETQGA